MPGASSAERAAPALDLSPLARTAMVAIAFIPFLHATAVVAPVALVLLDRADPGVAAWSLPLLYLVPPLVVRAVILIRPLPAGRIDLGSPAFLRWWFTAQWQMVFARLPFLEELLRLVPGIYSLWLRLWGARVGALVYWSPGVVILDRPLVRIGSRVSFGAGARINPHVVAPDGDATALYVAPVSIEDDALVGGYSLLLPGCSIAAGEVTPPLRSIHAFSRWEGGRRVAADAAASVEEAG